MNLNWKLYLVPLHGVPAGIYSKYRGLFFPSKKSPQLLEFLEKPKWAVLQSRMLYCLLVCPSSVSAGWAGSSQARQPGVVLQGAAAVTGSGETAPEESYIKSPNSSHTHKGTSDTTARQKTLNYNICPQNKTKQTQRKANSLPSANQSQLQDRWASPAKEVISFQHFSATKKINTWINEKEEISELGKLEKVSYKKQNCNISAVIANSNWLTELCVLCF